MSFVNTLYSRFATLPPPCPTHDEVCVPCAQPIMEDSTTLAFLGVTAALLVVFIGIGVSDGAIRSAYTARVTTFIAHSKATLQRAAQKLGELVTTYATSSGLAAVTSAKTSLSAVVTAANFTAMVAKSVGLATTRAAALGMTAVEVMLLSCAAVVRDTVLILVAYFRLDILVDSFRAGQPAAKQSTAPPTCCSKVFSSTNDLLNHLASDHRVSVGLVNDEKQDGDDGDRDISKGWDAFD